MSPVRVGVAAAAAGLVVVALALADGGYFPTAWGWAAAVPLLVAGGALALRDRFELGRLDLLWLAALAALAGWIGLSALWSPAVETPLLELERALVYVALVTALLLVASRRDVPALAAGTLAGISLVCLDALATRLAPDRFGTFDPSGGYQLSGPIGYWNATGLLAAMGILLAVALAVDGSRLAAVPLPLLACTLLFTFSRGAWIALALGLVVLAALHPDRPRLVAVGLLLAPAPALAAWLCSRPESLNAPSATLEAAARDGHRLAAVVAVLTVAEAAVGILCVRRDPRLRVDRRLVAAGAVVLAVLALVRAGSPLDAWDTFTSPVPSSGGRVGDRLFSASGNGRSDYWRVALGETADHPLLGGGAGSYAAEWARERPTAFEARDAHDLYLEALAELGPLGLALLLAALGIPLAALARARREPLVAGAGAAYCAFLVHAALDWDWELPAVTAPALVLGGVAVLAARSGTARTLPRALALGAVALALVFAFVMHAGNSAVASAQSALDHGRPAAAADDARAARRWLPWAATPWQRLAEAQLAQGDAEAARASLGRALERAPESWELWYELATASNGGARARALARARELNPRSPQVAALAAG